MTVPSLVARPKTRLFASRTDHVRCAVPRDKAHTMAFRRGAFDHVQMTKRGTRNLSCATTNRVEAAYAQSTGTTPVELAMMDCEPKPSTESLIREHPAPSRRGRSTECRR